MDPQNDELCLECSNRFSDKDFWDPSPKASLRSKEWGFFLERRFLDIKNSTCCPICRLVCKALEKRVTPALPADDSTIYYSRVLYGKYEADKSVRCTGQNMSHDPEIPDWELHRTFRLRVSTIPQHENLAEIKDERFLQTRGYEQYRSDEDDEGEDDEGEYHEGDIMLLSEETDTRKFLHGRKISPRLNFGLAKEWIDTCCENHGPCNQLGDPFEPTEPLRVINTEKLMVQKTPVGCRYAALSYTWGPPSIPQLRLQRDTEAQFTRPGGLKEIEERIPRIITDAITLCRELKITYLWVDALCRGAGDEYERERRIEDISPIYARAYFTIVGNGRDSQSGLKGVCPDSHRRCQQSARVGQISLAISKPLIDEAMDRSGWMQRAWTLSELLLSRHLLIFTDYQVFFLCKDKDRIYSEDTQCEAFPCGVMKIKNVDLPSVDRIWKSPKEWESHKGWESLKEWESFTAYVEEYTKRRMTNENDLLSGFEMLKRRFENDLGKDFLYDLPIQFFPQALCFLISSGKRRTSLKCPSWSWHGWSVSGRESFEFMSTYGFIFHETKPSTYYYVGKVPETGKLQFMPMSLRPGVETALSLVPEEKQAIAIYGKIRKLETVRSLAMCDENRKMETVRSLAMCDEIWRLEPFPQQKSKIEDHITRHLDAAAIDDDDHAAAVDDDDHVFEENSKLKRLPCPLIIETLPPKDRENLLAFTALTMELCVYRGEEDKWDVVVPQGGKTCLTPVRETVGEAFLNTTDCKDGDSFKFIFIGFVTPNGEREGFLLVTKAAGYRVFHRVGCTINFKFDKLERRFTFEMVYLI